MERRKVWALGAILSVIAVGSALLSFYTLALWGFALALVAIVSGVLGALASRVPAKQREPLGLIGLGAGVIGIVMGAIKTIGWAIPLIIR